MVMLWLLVVCVFFFQQKTAYEMRISDWSSDVCSSDLEDQHAVPALAPQHLLPREGGDIDLVPRQVVGEHRAGRIGEAQSFAVGGDPFAIGDARAGGGDRKSVV